VLEKREELLDEAEATICRACSLEAGYLGVLKARSALLRARGRFSEAAVTAATVVARNPGEPTAYRELGLNKLYLGHAEAAVEWFRRADRVAPHDAHRWTWLQGLGRTLMQLGRNQEPVDVLQTVASNPSFNHGRALLAAAEALAGLLAEATEARDAALRLAPHFTIAKFRAQLVSNNPAYLAQRERLYEGLRAAGVPEG
jgi:tetratricopeptide (TPR) repeat protein